MWSPSRSRGSLPSASARFRKCAAARRSDRRSPRRARSSSSDSQATSVSSCSATRAADDRARRPRRDLTRAPGTAGLGEQLGDRAALDRALASPSRIPARCRRNAAVDAAPSALPSPRTCAACASRANTASWRSISRRNRISSSASPPSVRSTGSSSTNASTASCSRATGRVTGYDTPTDTRPPNEDSTPELNREPASSETLRRGKRREGVVTLPEHTFACQADAQEVGRDHSCSVAGSHAHADSRRERARAGSSTRRR